MDEDIFNSMVSEPVARYSKAHLGITKSEFLSVVSMTGLNLTDFSALLPVSKRTIEKVKDDELLSPVVSDRVLQIGALYQMGINLFGGSASFREWLVSPLLAMGGKKPMDFMDNDTGISIVRDLLGRIEHGVYS